MDAKEAVRIIGKMYKAQPINERLSVDNAALSTAISALEKVETLEAENAKLKKELAERAGY